MPDKPFLEHLLMPNVQHTLHPTLHTRMLLHWLCLLWLKLCRVKLKLTFSTLSLTTKDVFLGTTSFSVRKGMEYYYYYYHHHDYFKRYL